MRKLGFLFGALLIAALTYGAVSSGAWFTDSDSVPVSATAAKIDIEAGGADSTSITLSNLLPGDTKGPFNINVYNTGNSTVPVKYRFTADDPESDPLFNALEVEVRHGHCVNVPLGHDDTVGVVYSGPLPGLEVTSATSITGAAGLDVNITHCYSFSFTLPETAGNALQGESATFDIVIDATQLNNPGWTE